MENHGLNDVALDRIFRTARTRNAWLAKPVAEQLVRAAYDLAKWGPTSANTCPARFVFVHTLEGKARLKPHLYPTNVDKTMSSPLCVIVAYDTRFYKLMPQLFPGRDMRAVFEGNTPLILETAQRNSSLQGAYLIIAARALGLDCGPMSGFHPTALDATFFPDGRWKSNFLVNIGYGSAENLFPRNPRLPFEDACRFE